MASPLLLAISRLRCRRWPLGPAIHSACFLALAFALTYLVMDPKLIYHGHAEYLWYPIQVSGLSETAEISDAPGVALEYLAARLAYLYHSSWAGALVISTTAWLLSVLTGTLLPPGGGRWLRPMRFLPGILLLVQYARYRPYLADALALLFALLLVWAYRRLPARGMGLRVLLFAGLAIVSYAVGAPGFVVFCALYVILEVSSGGHIAMAPVLSGIAAAVAYLVGLWGYGLGPIQAFGAALPAHPEAGDGGILTAGLFVCTPAIALGARLWQRRSEAGGTRALQSEPLRPAAGAQSVRGISWCLTTLALVSATSGAVLVAADTGTRAVLRVNYFARHFRWTELLEASRQVPADRYSVYVNCDVNRALYHTGRLASDLFSYPQHGSGSLLLTGDQALPPSELVRRSIRQAEVLCDLGLVNQAEHYAHEALEQAGYCPVAVQRLALVDLVKGLPEAAGVYLRALSRDPLYRGWAQEYLAAAADSSRLADLPEIRRARALMLKRDMVGDATPLELFQENDHNQMAFEYLMAYALLEGQHAPVTYYLGYLDTYGYPAGRIPRHYEEAVLVQERMTGATADLHGRAIDPETAHRFESFLARSQELGPDPSAVLQGLSGEFGNTYYYYYLWLRSQKTQQPPAAPGTGPAEAAGAQR